MTKTNTFIGCLTGAYSYQQEDSNYVRLTLQIHLFSLFLYKMEAEVKNGGYQGVVPVAEKQTAFITVAEILIHSCYFREIAEAK